MDRWAIFVDIEGFSKIYPENIGRALLPLGALMEGIYHVGNQVCSSTPDRLFAHHIGDGFVIVSEFSQRCPELPVAIGTFLLRNTLLAGGMAKCAISIGDFADIQGCYPDVIRENLISSDTVRLGDGFMRIFPVMGSALINSYRLSGKESGSLLLVDADILTTSRPGLVVTKTAQDYFVVDWIHSATQEIAEIEAKTGISHPKGPALEHLARDYLRSNQSSIPPAWVRNTQQLNRL